MSKPKLIFYHIPKTGGTTIKSIFRDRFNSLILDSYDFRDSQKINYKSFIQSTDKPIEYIHIHEWCPWNFCNIKPKKDDFTFTIIRHPISLFYSIYYHIRKNLSDFIENKDLDQKNSLFINLITKCKDINELIDIILDIGYLFNNKDIFLPKGYYDASFLEKLDFVGIFEEMNETLDKLSMTISNKLEKKVELKNVHKNTGSYVKDYSYRYNELSCFFSNEIAIYKKFLLKFNEKN